MTHTTHTRSDAAPLQRRILAENQSIYPAPVGDLDLSGEIRLMRAVLSDLARDIPANHRSMTAVLSVLVRAVYVQAKQLGGASDLERALLEAAELVLRRSEQKGSV